MRVACLDCGLSGPCSWAVGYRTNRAPFLGVDTPGPEAFRLPSLPFLTPSRPKAVTPSPLLGHNPLAPPPSQPF